MSFFSNFFQSKRERDDFFVALALLFLFSGVIYYCWDSGMFDTQKTNPPINEINQPLADKMTIPIDKINTNTNPTGQYADSSDLMDDFKIKDSLEQAILDMMDKQKAKEESEESADIEDGEEIEYNYEDEPEAYTDASITKPAKKNVPKTYDKIPKKPVIKDDLPPEFTTRGKTDTKLDCAIILGAFSSSTNANILLKKLEKNGYTTHHHWSKKMKVVGIKAACGDEALLKEMKKDYNDKAYFKK